MNDLRSGRTTCREPCRRTIHSDSATYRQLETIPCILRSRRFFVTTLPLVAVGFMFAALAAAQTPGTAAKPGPVGMVLPIPGHPLSAEQIEERATQPSGGPVSTEIVKSKVYRDTAGRLRIEMTI